MGSLNIVIFPKIHLGSQKYHPCWPSKPVDSVLSQAPLLPSPMPTEPSQACHELAETPAAHGQGTSWGEDACIEALPMTPAQSHFLSVPNLEEGKSEFIRALGTLPGPFQGMAAPRPPLSPKADWDLPLERPLFAAWEALGALSACFCIDHRESFLGPGGEFCISCRHHRPP